MTAPVESMRQSTTVSKSRSVDVPDGVDREVIQCSSTTCIVEDELPQPGTTRNMWSKFRELELELSAADSKSAIPLPVSRSASIVSPPRNSARSADYARKEVDQLEREVVRPSSGRSTEGHRDDDGTNGPSSAGEVARDELPQQGTARSLLARWRTIEEAGRERVDATSPTKRSSAAKRSQSTSRVEGRRPRVTRRNSDEDNEDRYYARTRTYEMRCYCDFR